MSIIPCKEFLPEHKQPMIDDCSFRPRLLSGSSIVSFTSRKFSNRSFHCSSKALLWTSIRVLTFLLAIMPMANTVFPNAVVADSVPMLCFAKASIAFCCSSRSLPLNVTLMLRPGFVLSEIVTLTLCWLKTSQTASSHPRGSAR